MTGSITPLVTLSATLSATPRDRVDKYRSKLSHMTKTLILKQRFEIRACGALFLVVKLNFSFESNQYTSGHERIIVLHAETISYTISTDLLI